MALALRQMNEVRIDACAELGKSAALSPEFGNFRRTNGGEIH